MTLKETFVAPTDTKETEPVKVRYTTFLQDQTDYDELHGFNPEYMIIAFIKKSDGTDDYVFSAARRHDELHDALNADFGDLEEFTDGELWFSKPILSLKCTVGTGKEEERISSFFSRINHDFLDNRGIKVLVLNGPNNYFYNPISRHLEKRPRTA